MTDKTPDLPTGLAESLAHSKTEYKQLGKSGLRVSVPIFGCMSFGHKDWAPWVVEEEEVCSALLCSMTCIPTTCVFDGALVDKYNNVFLIGAAAVESRLGPGLEYGTFVVFWSYAIVVVVPC